MKKILYTILLVLMVAGISYGKVMYAGGGGALPDTNCNQAKYFPLGTLCQDTDDGKLYKGTGAGVEEIASGTVDNTPDNGGTDAAGEDWAYDHANGISPHVAFNVPTLIQTMIPQEKTYETEDASETFGTDFTSTRIKFIGDNDADSDTIIIEDGTVDGQDFIGEAYALIDADDNIIFDFESNSTCANCSETSGLITLSDVGQWFWMTWNSGAWHRKFPILSIDVTVPVPNIADPDTWTLTTNYGHYTGSAAGAVTLTAPTIYDSIMFDTEGAGVMTIDAYSTNHIWLDGEDCGEGVAIVSSGTTGDKVVIKYRTSTTLSATSNGFSCVE